MPRGSRGCAGSLSIPTRLRQQAGAGWCRALVALHDAERAVRHASGWQDPAATGRAWSRFSIVAGGVLDDQHGKTGRTVEAELPGRRGWEHHWPKDRPHRHGRWPGMRKSGRRWWRSWGCSPGPFLGPGLPHRGQIALGSEPPRIRQGTQGGKTAVLRSRFRARHCARWNIGPRGRDADTSRWLPSRVGRR